MAKDLFSSHSQLYQLARPTYPESVMNEILKHVHARHIAWDCGAGSGQFTQRLSPYFDQVIATDLSAQQLAQAPQLNNVSYEVQPAEKTTFKEQMFDLVTVAQAIHWFNFGEFYREVKRTLKPNGIFAVIGYGLLKILDSEINTAIQYLYYQILKGYWDTERRYIDEEYQSIPFPFHEIKTPQLMMNYEWSAAQLLDYLNTWSAIKHYRQQTGNDPLAQLTHVLKHHEKLIALQFPILLRVGSMGSV